MSHRGRQQGMRLLMPGADVGAANALKRRQHAACTQQLTAVPTARARAVAECLFRKELICLHRATRGEV